MNIKRMGRTGLKVSEVCLGTMTFGKQSDEPTAFAILDLAAGAGVNFIDTADVYPVPPSLDLVGRTEEIVGKWIKGKRDQFILATKCGNAMGGKPNDTGLSRKHILEAVEGSLRRLQTDVIDLTRKHLSTRPYALWRISSGAEKLATSGAPTLPPGRLLNRYGPAIG